MPTSSTATSTARASEVLEGRRGHGLEVGRVGRDRRPADERAAASRTRPTACVQALRRWERRPRRSARARSRGAATCSARRAGRRPQGRVDVRDDRALAVGPGDEQRGVGALGVPERPDEGANRVRPNLTPKRTREARYRPPRRPRRGSADHSQATRRRPGTRARTRARTSRLGDRAASDATSAPCALKVWKSGRKCGILLARCVQRDLPLQDRPKGRLPVPAAFRQGPRAGGAEPRSS